jgi:hypothetical protein
MHKLGTARSASAAIAAEMLKAGLSGRPPKRDLKHQPEDEYCAERERSDAREGREWKRRHVACLRAGSLAEHGAITVDAVNESRLEHQCADHCKGHEPGRDVSPGKMV